MGKRLGLLFFVLAVFGMKATIHAQNSAQKLLQQKTQHQLQHIITHSPAITGLVVVDLKNDSTDFSFNSNISFAQASAIKIPILMEVYKQARAGKFKLSDKRTIKPKNIVGGTGVIKTMDTPVELTIRNICVLMISLSDNSATNSLIDLVGMDNVNATMKSLGMEKTKLRRKMMDTEASSNGRENVSTPAEAAQILRILYDGEFISNDISSGIISLLKKPARIESRLAKGIPEDVTIAFKPGELNGVSTEWAFILLPERPYAVSVMESYKPDTKGRAMEKISKILYSYYWRLGNATRYGTYADSKWK